MTDIFINCKRHGLTRVKIWNLSHDRIDTECGCEFKFNSGYIEDLTANYKTQKEERESCEPECYNPDNDPNRLMWR